MADKKGDAPSGPSAAKVKQARTKSPHKQRQRTCFSILAMLCWVLASVIASQVAIGILLLLIVGEDRIEEPLWMAVYSALSYVVALALVIFVPPRISASWQNRRNKKNHNSKTIEPKVASREELGLKGWPTWTDIGLAPIGFIVQIILAGLLVAVFSLFPWFDAEQAQDVGFNVLNSGVDRILAFISLAVVAPIAEEIIFRGWLYGKLRRKLSGQVSEIAGIIISILLVSLLFGIVHMQWNVGVNVFAASVVLCGLREFTGTIYSGIIIHMIKNGVAFYLLYVAGI